MSPVELSPLPISFSTFSYSETSSPLPSPLHRFSYPKSQSPSKAVSREKWRSFDVHFGTTCAMCTTSPIIGVRYMNVRRKNINLCEKCYANNEVAQNEMTFQRCRWVWECVEPGKEVPSGGLKRGDQGPRVKFLHKVLMDVGVMGGGLMPGKLRFYGENTRITVEELQRWLGVKGCEPGVYDDATAQALEKWVTQENCERIPVEEF